MEFVKVLAHHEIVYQPERIKRTVCVLFSRCWWLGERYTTLDVYILKNVFTLT